RTTYYFSAPVKEDENVQDLNQTLLVAKLRQVFVQHVIKLLVSILLPFLVKAVGRLGRSIPQAHAVIARHHQLHGIKEGLDKMIGLVGQILANAFFYRYLGSLELQNAYGYTIQIQHDIGPLVVLAPYAYLFGDGKIVVLWMFPIDKMNRLLLGTFFCPYIYSVAQHVVHFFIAVVQLIHLYTRGSR